MKKVYNIFANVINCILKMDISEYKYMEILAAISGKRISDDIINGLPSQLL